MANSFDRVTRRTVLKGAASIAGAAFYASASVRRVAAQRSKEDYVVWDVHGHLNTPGNTPRERMASLLRVADRMGIERVVVFMGYPFAHDPEPDEMVRQNDQIIDAMEQADGRALGFVYLNPRHTHESLEELDRCVRDGPMVGVKLWVALRCADDRLDPIVSMASQLKAPILQHTWDKATGNLPGESTAQDLAALARRHADASFIAAHIGGQWEQGIRAVREAENVTAEICGSDPTSGFVEMAVRELGDRRVMYGSDFAGRSIASQLAKVTGADIPDASKRWILAGNLKRLLTPICSEKGIQL